MEEEEASMKKSTFSILTVSEGFHREKMEHCIHTSFLFILKALEWDY